MGRTASEFLGLNLALRSYSKGTSARSCGNLVDPFSLLELVEDRNRHVEGLVQVLGVAGPAVGGHVALEAGASQLVLSLVGPSVIRTAR